MITSKLPQVGTNIFTIMSTLAASHNAINLGQGFPDFPMDEDLIDLVTEAMKNGQNQYSHMAGYLPLREAIAEKINLLYGRSVCPEKEITITPGGTYAIYTAFTTVLQPGDEVIVFEPAYDSYIPNILVNGAIPVVVKLKFPDYKINWEEVQSLITNRTKMLIINSPHNPTGSVLSEDDILALQQLVATTNIFIISDEVYEHLIFGNKIHLSLIKYPDLAKRTFVIASFGKVYNCTGWKLGYCLAPPQLTEEFRKIHQFNCFSCFTPAQIALASYLKHKEKYLQLGRFMEEKQQLFQNAMAATPLRPLPTYGSYFQLYSFEGIAEITEQAMAKILVEKAGVASIPVSAFYSDGNDNKVLRFCFAKKTPTLLNAANKLTSFFENGFNLHP